MEQNHTSAPVSEKRTVVISATFTAEPIKPFFDHLINDLGLPLQLEFAAFNQVFQSLLSPEGSFGQNRAGINVVLARMEDLSSDGTKLVQNANSLADAIQSYGRHQSRPLLVIVTPSSDNYRETHGTWAKDLIASACEMVSQCWYFDGRELATDLQVKQYQDPEAFSLGRIPYREEYFAALAIQVVRACDGLIRQPFKVIAVDADDTLWSGICGEDGPEGVKITAARQALQEVLLKQREQGMLLALASKNNASDVWETFAAHPEMPLRREHVTISRINWEDKPTNLISMARQLNVGLDSFVFIDDNPKEIAEMQLRAPQVTALQLPTSESAIQPFLESIWPFDHWRKATAEDSHRAESYSQQEQRKSLASQSANYADFLASLQLELTISPATSDQLPRMEQLFARTNQMNTTTIRRSAAEIEQLQNSGWKFWTASAKDRFGSYGLIGLIAAEAADSRLTVDSLLLSCRAFGRGIEHALLRTVAKEAEVLGFSEVAVSYKESAKNQPARELWNAIAGRKERFGELENVIADRDWLSRFTYEPTEIAQEAVGVATLPSQDISPLRHRLPYDRIANELHSAAGLIQSMERYREANSPKSSAEELLPGLEAELADIWRDLLKLPSVGRADGFFDLGGHSLLAVQLLARINERFNVNLSLEVIYQGELTVSELAKTVEMAQLGDLSAEEYAALVAEVEGLSDEEVRALLGDDTSK
jgi:FkbH-like protein